ncbi:hypothetical protein O8C89_03495 [Aliarcobacter butzleri]|uniref:hypothetical protein n=1 Tax=Aliarcobacter butzleri TaxID=28197 RepID=UPI00263CBE99|nr:hypothetical protein [Aliarcobacter butzleri]MDN5079583.1 hypothetical protein [Aliarcobacter butzleri]
MKKIIPINYNSSDFDNYIYDENSVIIKGKEKIHENIASIKSKITDYESNKHNLENLEQTVYTVASDTECKKLLEEERNNELYCCLYKLYDSKSNHSKKFKQSIRDISKKCPYCSIDTPSHLDHYLPRSIFPEFSVLSLNLIYSCSICNSNYKGDKYLNDADERLYINPYFDDFIDTISFLKCKIEVPTTSIYPEFNFYIDDSLQATHNYEYKIVKNHFDNLNLETRYLDQIVDEKFKRFKNRYIDKERCQFKTVTLEQLKDNIQYELDGLDELNINNWEKVFWISLKNCDECLNLIVNKQIPIN